MFESFEDWWRRVGRWQHIARRQVAARYRRGELAPSPHPVVRMLMMENALRDAAIDAMLDACPNYDGDLSEFGEEPVERAIRTGILPPRPWPGRKGGAAHG